ncbi:hypothetical protein LINPERHAP1_LOCUS8480, partial [Linum perenne]
IGKILTWIRLPKLPIHFFNQTAITRIGNHIGRTIRLDLATAEGAPARYARVYIEVDLSEPLLGKYMIGDRVFLVEYESLENVYFVCGKYGHKMDACPTVAPSQALEVAEEPSPAAKDSSTEDGDVGSWMTVTRRRHPKNHASKVAEEIINPGGDSSGSQSKRGSRFSVLQR